MSTGAIKSLKGVLEAIITVEPYSPTAREKPNATPVKTAGNKGGKITSRKFATGLPLDTRRLLLFPAPFLPTQVVPSLPQKVTR